MVFASSFSSIASLLYRFFFRLAWDFRASNFFCRMKCQEFKWKSVFVDLSTTAKQHRRSSKSFFFLGVLFLSFTNFVFSLCVRLALCALREYLLQQNISPFLWNHNLRQRFLFFLDFIHSNRISFCCWLLVVVAVAVICSHFWSRKCSSFDIFGISGWSCIRFGLCDDRFCVALPFKWRDEEEKVNWNCTYLHLSPLTMVCVRVRQVQKHSFTFEALANKQNEQKTNTK